MGNLGAGGHLEEGRPVGLAHQGRRRGYLQVGKRTPGARGGPITFHWILFTDPPVPFPVICMIFL